MASIGHFLKYALYVINKLRYIPISQKLFNVYFIRATAMPILSLHQSFSLHGECTKMLPGYLGKMKNIAVNHGYLHVSNDISDDFVITSLYPLGCV
jgi:hypothetical protein